MNKYTISYQYGSYSGEQVVWADDENEAINKMWRSMKKDMSLPMAYQSATVINVEYDAE